MSVQRKEAPHPLDDLPQAELARAFHAHAVKLGVDAVKVVRGQQAVRKLLLQVEVLFQV